MTQSGLVLLLSAALLLPAAAQAQTKGGAVPPYQPPVQAAPPVQATPDPITPPDAASRPDPFASNEAMVAQFAAAYATGGRPRLAFYWNRQLTDNLAQWYSDSRVVSTDKSTNTTEGDLNLRQSGNRQSVVEVQRRDAAGERARPAKPESWEWEFQDGFLAPFLKADAQVMDRTAILRIMGASSEGVDPRTTEVMALQNLADLLVEVLVANSPSSTTGYELRARVLDMKTGRLLAMVNSRSLKEWQRGTTAIATSRGFELPDEDDEGFGPERADQRYKATGRGFEQRRRPPKLSAIADNLATNVMNAMIPRLDQTARPATAAPQPLTTTTPAAPARARPAPNQSAVPLPEIEAKPLAAPRVAAPPPGEEPPMPKPTRQ